MFFSLAKSPKDFFDKLRGARTTAPRSSCLLGNLDGVDGTALSGLPDLVVLLGEDLVLGGGDTLLRQGEDPGTQVGTQAAADAVGIDMSGHTIKLLFSKIHPQDVRFFPTLYIGQKGQKQGQKFGISLGLK